MSAGSHAETQNCDKAGSASEIESIAGTRFGDYELLQEIGRGGMGVVYKARQIKLNRMVALKRISAGQLASELEVERFRREAEMIALLAHPNIVPIFEVSEHGGVPYFSMGLIEKGNLPLPSRPKDIDIRAVVNTMRKIARGVHYAHQRGVLHRDLKPANILINASNEPQVCDFGIAKFMDTDESLTVSGASVGTPAYMAPEQAVGDSTDISVATDVYGLGALFYEMLTGRPPFEGKNPIEILRDVTQEPPISPRQINPEVDRDLETICLKCLEKAPARRYRSAEEFAEELDRWWRGELILARPAGVLEKTLKWSHRRPALAVLAVGFVISALILTIVIFQYNNRLQRETTYARQQQHLAEKASASLAKQKQVLEGINHRNRMHRAEEYFRENRPREGLAYLASLVQLQPENRAANERLYSALVHEGFRLPRYLEEIHDSPSSPGETGASPQHDTNRLTQLQDEWRSAFGIQDAHAKNGFLSWQLQPSPGPDRNASIWHAERLNFMTLSSDGQRLATANRRQGTSVFALTNGNRLWQSSYPEDASSYLQFHPSGDLLLTSNAEGEARLRHSHSGKPASPVLVHSGEILIARFASDGNRLLTVDRTGNIYEWNGNTGALKSAIMNTDNEFSFLAMDPDSGFIAGRRDHRIEIWDAPNEELRSVLPGRARRDTRAKFFPRGNRLLTYHDEGEYALWDARHATSIRQGAITGSGISRIDISADGELLAAILKNHTVSIIEADSGRTISNTLQHGEDIAHFEFLTTEERFVTATRSGSFQWWDIPTGKPVSHTLYAGQGIDMLALTPNHPLMAIAEETGLVRFAPVPHPLTLHETRLVDLAKWVGGYQLMENGDCEPLPLQERTELERRFRLSAPEDDAIKWKQLFSSNLDHQSEELTINANIWTPNHGEAAYQFGRAFVDGMAYCNQRLTRNPGQLVLVPRLHYGTGSVQIEVPTEATASFGFIAEWKVFISRWDSRAYGFSFCFSDLPDQVFDESGAGNGLRIEFSLRETKRIRIRNGSDVLLPDEVIPFHYKNQAWETVKVMVLPDPMVAGQFQIRILKNDRHEFVKATIPNWEPLPSWRFGFGARNATSYRQGIFLKDIRIVAGNGGDQP